MGITLAQLEIYSKIDYRVQLLKERLGVDSYEGFVKALYRDLDWCVEKVQNEKKYLQPDNNGEDRISAFIRNSLEGLMYYADAKFVAGGNTDLTIKSFNGQFQWIGEAKLVDSVNNSHIWGGFLQLAKRYTNGDETNGGILIYIFASDAKSLMRKYKEYTTTKKGYNFTYEDCKTRLAGGFYSTHKHHSSGLDFKTRHIPVILHYNPEK
ncbi:hypothetical protein KI659_18300 [Litoribacter alkaliphilus]|uniref:Restriction endonuclease n=1 Tax=Litoribacter ruber TaxID=702568 RepID=A0AAP2CJR3_9BACT|nr:hypothetical protein [Litoribacter alkaliphilus]MBS9525978.1 hypothetical protein [Litoribacter alkaliphilus]